ncbi:MAG: hypothetical protein V1728_01840 [Candidatus Micrarchaeota archaeon]
MADFLGISKRKWLAFGILSAVSSLIAQAGFFFGYHTFFSIDFLIGLLRGLIILALADFVICKCKEFFHIKMRSRYIAFYGLIVISLLFILLTSGPNSLAYLNSFFGPASILVALFVALAVATIILIEYIICDFLAGLVFPPAPVKSKSNEKKSNPKSKSISSKKKTKN